MALEAQFKRPFDEQVAFFRGKLGNPITTEKWTDVWKSAHDTGFMVAGAAKADLLADFAGAVDKTIAEGKSIGWFREQFDAIVEKHGWSYRGEYNWRTRTIYRTNMATSYAAGRLAQLEEGGFSHWMYRHSDSVAHPRPLHVSWDGLTLPANDPWWQTHYPPNGWGCQCYVIGVSERTAKRIGGRLEPAPDDGLEPDGRPKGIDKGWDYQPGATVADRVRQTLAEKLPALPKNISSGLKKDIDSSTNGATLENMDAAIPQASSTSKEKFMKVEIVKSTEKAHLIKDEAGREAWIQKRWLRADGTVNAETFNRQAGEKIARAAEKAAADKATQEFKNGFHPVEVARESEKAIAVEARWEEFASDQSGKRMVWFPKSQIKDGKVPGWLLQAKAKELRESITRMSVQMEIEIAGHRFYL